MQEFKAHYDDVEILTHTVNCELVVDDPESACTLTRFFLGDSSDWDKTVTRHRVEEYARSHFTYPGGCPATRMPSCCCAAEWPNVWGWRLHGKTINVA